MSLVFGLRSLVFGFWFLVFGFWFLVLESLVLGPLVLGCQVIIWLIVFFVTLCSGLI